MPNVAFARGSVVLWWHRDASRSIFGFFCQTSVPSSENTFTPDRYLATGLHKDCPLPFPVRPGLQTASPTEEAFLFRVNMKDLFHAPSPHSSRMIARAQLQPPPQEFP